MTSAYIVSARRTPFGTFGGSLKDGSATDLATEAARAALQDAGAPLERFDHVFMGNVQQTSGDASYLARHVGLRVGLPEEVPALTVNRLCGSGFEAVVQAAQQIRLGEAQLVLAGGTEAMSMAPHAAYGARWGLKLGVDAPLVDTLWAGLTDRWCELPMGQTAENLADRYAISREACDAHALRSQQRWAAAQAEGAFAPELVSVALPGKEPFAVDEHPRETSLDRLAKLKPVFQKDGRVTAGNASGICDGAAALVVASEDAVKSHDLPPLARVVACAVVGVDPKVMGIGPAPAYRRVLERAGWDRADLVEVNEAFAAQYLAVEQELQLDPDRTNIHGGAIALGHPLGASGARIVGHLAHALVRTDAQRAVGTACIGGGQGIAIALEAV